ncbi:LOW QUALITY PROTEIN: hypothetical protein PanWU01x14_009280, partial [Parasponia andersonii]
LCCFRGPEPNNLYSYINLSFWLFKSCTVLLPPYLFQDEIFKSKKESGSKEERGIFHGFILLLHLSLRYSSSNQERESLGSFPVWREFELL